MFFIFVAFIIFVFFFWYLKNNSRENFQDFSPKYTLCILATAKNEEMVIQEFIEHYKWQGVEHIYLIDNGSTDNMSNVLQPYVDEGYVSYYFMDGLYKQTENYNVVYEKIKNNTKWLIVCDIDEYIYNRNREQNIKNYVESIDYQSTNAIHLRWKLFGSSGHEKQPSSIRESFLWRKIELDGFTKCIVNTTQTQSLEIHSHNYKNPNMDIINCPPELALNHYPIMSLEYFQKVKMTRGAADQEMNANVRNMDYFQKYDHHEIEDTELKDLLALSYSNK